MRKLSFIFFILFAGNSIASALPNCPSDASARYHNCFGTYTYAGGDKYVGEFKDDKYHGQGTYTFASGSIQRGYSMNGYFVLDICEDMGLTKGSESFGQCVLKLIDEIDEDD